MRRGLRENVRERDTHRESERGGEEWSGDRLRKLFFLGGGEGRLLLLGEGGRWD